MPKIIRNGVEYISVGGAGGNGNYDDSKILAEIAAIEQKLGTVEEGAQVNKIDGVSSEFEISAQGKILSITSIDKTKIAGLDELLAGITKVQSSADINKVSIGDDGTMEVNSLSVSKLVQEDDEELILNCGKSAD